MSIFTVLIVTINLSVVVAVMAGVLDPIVGTIINLILFNFCLARMVMDMCIYRSLINKSNDD